MTDRAQLERLGLFDARAPRYTSYPTAPHFSTAVQAPQFQSWLGSVAPKEPVSLYVHIPFCKRLCWFCACRTQGIRTDDPVVSYLRTLKTEIAMVAAALPKGTQLARLHWGGGTPTILNGGMIEDLSATIASALPFAEGAEFSVEIDPNEVDDARLDALAAAGMTRASIGIQDFAPEIQKTIGREQSFEITKEVSEKLRARGIESLNTDILFGLPHQTLESISDTTKKLLSLSPDRVALYGYAHVPWMAKRQTMIPEAYLPASRERLGLFEAARDLFLAAGYDAIGIDHFAKPSDGLAQSARSGRMRRNFQGYTDDTAPTLIGVGASSISRFRQGYVQNASATAAYLGRIREGMFGSARGHALTPEDLLRGRVIEEVMCQFTVDLAAIEAELDHVPFDLRAEFARVEKVFAPFVESTRNHLTIKPAGQPLARMIAQEFDGYHREAGRHSAAM